MALTETITFESHPGWTLQARFFRDVKNAEEVGNLIVAGKLPVKTSVINAKLVPGERELRRNRNEGRKESARKGASSIPVGSRCSPKSKPRRPPPLALAILSSKTRRPSPSHPPPEED